MKLLAPKTILLHYPNCYHAVCWVELMICGKEDDDAQSTWEMMMAQSPPMSPQSVLACLRHFLEGERFGGAKLVAAEMETAEFCQYISGKMGYV